MIPAGSSRLSALPDWSAVPSNSEDDRLLVNRRVAYFGGLFFTLALAFYLYNSAVLVILHRRLPPFGAPEMLMHAGAILVFGLQWLACHRGRCSARQLNIVDVGGLLAGALCFNLLTIFEARGFENAIAVDSGRAEILLVALLSLALVVTHGVIVPATARRTFWVSTLTCSMAPIAAYLIAVSTTSSAELAVKPWLPAVSTGYVVMWCLLTIAVATTAARVIYGLQQQVRAATEIEQYTLEEKIGEGGMGVVYRARHALLRRPTAVKVLRGDSPGDTEQRRFEREVQLTSGLTHPNTVAVYDFGRTPEGTFYYAMEYLDGITLEDLVGHGGPLPAARAVALLRQAASALVEAHGVGLIHRDIKPANLMLCVRGQLHDQVKVLDFGLVKEFANPETSTATQAGQLLGTPHYMSPESILNVASSDARSDIYALGAVAYFLLVGQTVFAGTTLEVCGQHIHIEPVPPGQRAPAPVAPELEALILRCLAKAPATRPQSAQQLIDELDALPGLGSWTAAEARAWWQDNAAAMMTRVRDKRRASASRGSRTLAIDLDRRSPRAA